MSRQKAGYGLINDAGLMFHGAVRSALLLLRSGLDDEASISGRARKTNVSYSLQPKSDYSQAVLNAATQISREAVRAELMRRSRPANDALGSRYQKILDALAAGVIFTKTTGEKGPAYQWADASIEHELRSSVDEHFDHGPVRQLSITVSERVSAAVVYAFTDDAASLRITDPEDRREARDLGILAAAFAAEAKGISKLAVTRSLTDGVSAQDGIDPTYQFSDPEAGDVNYSISVKTGLPVDDPAVDRAEEVTWAVNVRVTRKRVEALIDDYIARAEDKNLTAKVEELRTALDLLRKGREIYWSRNGSDDEMGRYQWTNSGDPNVSYTLQAKPGFEDATVAVTTQVSRSAAEAQIALLAAGFKARLDEVEAEMATASAERKVKLQAVLDALTAQRDAEAALIEQALDDADGGIFFRNQQVGSADFSFGWTSLQNRNLSYSLSANTSVPFGRRNEGGGYSNPLTEVTFSRSERVSYSSMMAKARLVTDARKKQEALAAIDSVNDQGGAFYRATTGLKDPVYQWSKQDYSDENWSISVNDRVPQGIADANGVYPSYGTEYSFSHNVRVMESEVLAAIDAIRDAVKKAEARAAFQAALDENTSFFKSRAGDDDPVYQWSYKSDPNTNYTITLNDHVQCGVRTESGAYPAYTTEAVYSVNRRVSLQDTLALISGIPDAVKRDQAYLALFTADAIYRVQAGNDDPVYQWTNRFDPNESFSMTPNDRLGFTTFSRTARVSREEVAARYARLKDTGDSRYAGLEAALADARDNAFHVSRAGGDDPTYQWTSKTDKNLTYSLSLVKVPVGEALADGSYASYRVEVTFVRNTRASEADVRAAIALIKDQKGDGAEAAAVLGDLLTLGASVYRSLSDGESPLDGTDPVFQFTGLPDPDQKYSPDKSYSITVNSAAPDGPEATWNISTRVRRTEVARYITDGWFAGDDKDPKLLDALAALADSDDDAFYMSQAGTNDNVQFQWTSKSDPTQFSIAVRRTE